MPCLQHSCCGTVAFHNCFSLVACHMAVAWWRSRHASPKPPAARLVGLRHDDAPKRLSSAACSTDTAWLLHGGTPKLLLTSRLQQGCNTGAPKLLLHRPPAAWLRRAAPRRTVSHGPMFWVVGGGVVVLLLSGTRCNKPGICNGGLREAGNPRCNFSPFVPWPTIALLCALEG